jgi:hypothetical protein
MRLGWLRGTRWGRERSTGLCWWDQRPRLARGEPPAGPCVLGCPMQAIGQGVRMRCVNVLRSCALAGSSKRYRFGCENRRAGSRGETCEVLLGNWFGVGGNIAYPFDCLVSLKVYEDRLSQSLIESLSYSLNGSPLAGPRVCLGLACQQTTGPRHIAQQKALLRLYALAGSGKRQKL